MSKSLFSLFVAIMFVVIPAFTLIAEEEKADDTTTGDNSDVRAKVIIGGKEHQATAIHTKKGVTYLNVDLEGTVDGKTFRVDDVTYQLAGDAVSDLEDGKDYILTGKVVEKDGTKTLTVSRVQEKPAESK